MNTVCWCNMWHSQALLSKCALSEPSFLLKVKHNLRFTYLLYEESPRLYNAGILETYDPRHLFQFSSSSNFSPLSRVHSWQPQLIYQVGPLPWWINEYSVKKTPCMCSIIGHVSPRHLLFYNPTKNISYYQKNCSQLLITFYASFREIPQWPLPSVSAFNHIHLKYSCSYAFHFQWGQEIKQTKI